MVDLTVSYLGLSLRNPIIVSSSGLTDSADKVRKLEEYGAGAVVLKSLFEEQILNQANCMAATDDYPGAEDYIQGYMQGHQLGEYLDNLAAAKAKCGIPVIASINCLGEGQWVEFAKQVEEAGADALEVNMFFLPTDISKPSTYYEEQYLKTIEGVVKATKLPVSVKLTRQFTSPLHMLAALRNYGVKGAVLFNRFYEPDIDLAHRRVEASDVFSSEKELAPTLRWLALASAQIAGLDLAASTGVHTGEDVAKAILTGASAAQVCTTLYQHGPKHLEVLLAELDAAMDTIGVGTVEEMKGTMNYSKEGNTALFERSQFMKYFSSRA